MKRYITALLTLLGCSVERDNIATVTVNNGTSYTAFLISDDGHSRAVNRYSTAAFTFNVPCNLELYHNGANQHLYVTTSVTYTLR